MVDYVGASRTFLKRCRNPFCRAIGITAGFQEGTRRPSVTAWGARSGFDQCRPARAVSENFAGRWSIAPESSVSGRLKGSCGRRGSRRWPNKNTGTGAAVCCCDQNNNMEKRNPKATSWPIEQTIRRVTRLKTETNTKHATPQEAPLPSYECADVSENTKLLFLLLAGLVVAATGFFFNTPYEIWKGSVKILVSPANLLTDYIKLANMGSTFFNAGAIGWSAPLPLNHGRESRVIVAGVFVDRIFVSEA